MRYGINNLLAVTSVAALYALAFAKTPAAAWTTSSLLGPFNVGAGVVLVGVACWLVRRQLAGNDLLIWRPRAWRGHLAPPILLVFGRDPVFIGSCLWWHAVLLARSCVVVDDASLHINLQRKAWTDYGFSIDREQGRLVWRRKPNLDLNRLTTDGSVAVPADARDSIDAMILKQQSRPSDDA